MTERVLGPSGSTRRRRFLFWPILMAACTALFFVAGAQAVRATGAFELDGNATNGAVAGDDWDNVCHQVLNADCSTSSNTSGATAVDFTTDGTLSSSIYTGGGSKDPIDIDQWAWKNAGGLPDKDNLLHGFAARYSLTPSSTTCPSNGGPTCEVLFFGSDRYDNSGDAQQGFWFFQNKITLGTNAVGGGTGFVGVHKNGDLLIISDFSNGGTTSFITVYKWDTTCKKTGGTCGDANLRTLASSSTANCSTSADNAGFCGIVNTADGTTAPWDYTDKSGLHTYLAGEFYEGGVNLSTLGLANACFASVASETRSSTSTTATLKDFVLGNFGHCESGLVTTPKQGDGTDIPAGGLSIGTGSASAKDSADLKISGAASWSGNLQFYLCKVDAPATCTSGGTAIGSPIAETQATVQPKLSDAATVTSAGRYCWRGEFTSTTSGVPNSKDDTSGECFTVNPVDTSLTTHAGSAVTIGSSISDTADLAGTANKPGDPIINPTTPGDPAGGSITFTAYGPDDCTTVAFTSAAVPVAGDATYGPVSFTPTRAGTYHWKATYTGDSPNTNGTTDNAACDQTREDVIVSPKTPAIVTHQTPTTSQPLGTATSDTADISNTANKPDGTPAGGTVTFKLYGPRAVAGTANCNANLVYTSAAYAVSGNGTYPTASQAAATFTPTAAGTYDWQATYSGDSPNTSGPVSSGCGDEPITLISLQPTMDTVQRFRPNDSATVAVTSGAGNLAGSVRFKLYVGSATCANTAVYDSGAIDVTTGTGSGLSRTVSSNNTTEYVTDGTAFSWLVTYTSTNGGHKNVTSECNHEHSSITIANGTQSNTP